MRKSPVLVLTLAAVGCGNLDNESDDVEVHQSAFTYQQRCDAIDTKRMEPAMAFLGTATSGCNNLTTGASRMYQFGGIWFGDAVGRAHELHGLIYFKYVALGAQLSPLLYPKSDELTPRFGNGRYNAFQTGNILWHTGASEAFEIHGEILFQYGQFGSEAGNLGWPRSDEVGLTSPNRRKNDLDNGKIYWTPTAGAWPVVLFDHPSSNLETVGLARITGMSLTGFASPLLSFSAAGFTPNALVDVKLTNPGGVAWQGANARADAQGRITQNTYQIPDTTLLRTDGVATLWLRQDAAHQAVRGVSTGSGQAYVGSK